MKNSRVKLNPFFRVRFGETMVCDLFLEGKSFTIPDPRYLELLASLEGEHDTLTVISLIAKTFTLDSRDAESLLEEMLSCRLLVPADHEFPESKGIEHWTQRGWLDALMLHLSSRNMSFDDAHIANRDAQLDSMMKTTIEKDGPPEFWKKYSNRPEYVLADSEELLPQRPFQEVLLNRRSNRPWKSKQLSQQKLGTILKFANAETKNLRETAEKQWSASPHVLLHSGFSALEVYFFALSVEGLEPGLYHYDLQTHKAVLVRPGSMRDEIVKMCIGQCQPRDASCVFVITAVWKRYMFRYRHPRAYRNLLVNVAELAHKHILLATAMELSTFLTPALRDEYADSLLGVNSYDEAPLYVVAVG